MNELQAIQIIEQALKIANKAGAFELNDSAVIAKAIQLLNQHFQPTNGVDKTMQGEEKPSQEVKTLMKKK